jgi:hypothetical protein
MATERHYQRLAWLVVAASLLAFCGVLSGGAWLGFNYYVAQPNEPRAAILQRAHGSGLEVRHAGQKTAVVVPSDEGYALAEGDTVITDDNTDALITLFDNSRIQLSYNTSLTLQRMRSSRLQTQSKYFELVPDSGVIKVATADKSPYQEMKLLVDSADGAASVSVEANSAAIITTDASQADNIRMAASTTVGTVWMRAGTGRWQQVTIGKQAHIVAKEATVIVEAAATELVGNGEFKQASDDPSNPPPGWFVRAPEGWRVSIVPSSPITPSGTVALVPPTTAEPIPFLRIKRDRLSSGQPPKDPVQVSVRQDMDQVVSYYQQVQAGVRVQIADQTFITPGTYPLTLRVTYEDAEGHQALWNRSFYADGPLQFAPSIGVMQVGQSFWWADTTWDLMAQTPRPARIKAVELIITGYSFDVRATRVSLVAR